MCLISKKMLFASGAGFLALSFLCASNLENDFKIINGRGCGEIVEEGIHIPKELKKVENNEYILDKVTGDIFFYSHDMRKWLSKGNSGIHHAFNVFFATFHPKRQKCFQS